MGVVTNVGWAHIENFDSIEGIAAAKRELIESLPADGTAVLNADDPRVAAFARRASRPHRSRMDCRPKPMFAREDVESLPEGVKFRVGGRDFESPAHGPPQRFESSRRNRRGRRLWNPARSPAPKVSGISAPEKCAENVSSHDGILVYNDCYNSNPDAVRAMLDVLRDTPARRRIAVLGEMLELGRWAEPLHRDVGNYAAESGVDVLVGIRGAACYMLDAAKRAGLRADAAFFFEDPAEAGRLARSLARTGRRHPVQRFPRRARRTRSGAVSGGSAHRQPMTRRPALTHVVLAVLRKAVPSLLAVPRVSIRDVPHRHGVLHGPAALDPAGAVADRASAAVSNRPAYSRRRSASRTTKKPARPPWADC